MAVSISVTTPWSETNRMYSTVEQLAPPLQHDSGAIMPVPLKRHRLLCPPMFGGFTTESLKHQPL